MCCERWHVQRLLSPANKKPRAVGRFADLFSRSCLRDGLLQPVLLDWISIHSPPFSALFRPEA